MRLYESHITVDGLDEDQFVKICKSLSIKPVLIDRDTGSGVKQMMTAKFHRGSEAQAVQEMNSLAQHFPNILRLKLETIVPPSQHAPDDHLYLEFHSKFIVPEYELDSFVDWVESMGGHTSKNSLKYEAAEGMAYYFATTRDEATMRAIIRNSPYELVNTLRECVLLDTNPDIDRYWCACGGCGIKQIQL